MSYFTGNPQTDTQILFALDDESLINTCQTDRYFQQLCKENFWRQRFIETFSLQLAQDKPLEYSFEDWYFKIKPYVSKKGTFTFISFNEAVKNNDLEMVSYLYNYPQPVTTPNNAANQILQVYSKDKTGAFNELMHWALNVMDIYNNYKRVYNKTKIIKSAIEKLDIDTFLLLIALYETDRYERKIKHLNNFVRKALEFNNMDFIDRLIQDNLITGSDVTNILLEQDRFEDVEKYVQAGYLPTPEAEIVAAANYEIEKLEYLKSLGINPTAEGANYALNNFGQMVGNQDKKVQDQIETLEWYKSQGVFPNRPDMDDIPQTTLDWLNQNVYGQPL